MAHAPGADGWRDYHRRVRRLPPQVAAAVARQIAGHDERVLLLGVTRDYAELGRELTAVDWCAEQIASVWIGDGENRRAILADWREMDFGSERFTAVVGDGSLSTLTWPDDYRRALERVAASLVPGGRLVLRCFVAPDEPETVAAIAEDVFGGRVASFYSARWRLAMALARSGNVAVTAIREAFDRVFPDRRALAAATAWSLDTIAVIDAYRGSPLVFSFVTRDELLAVVGNDFAAGRFVSSGDYPMADRYPLLVAERR